MEEINKENRTISIIKILGVSIAVIFLSSATSTWAMLPEGTGGFDLSIDFTGLDTADPDEETIQLPVLNPPQEDSSFNNNSNFFNSPDIKEIEEQIDILTDFNTPLPLRIEVTNNLNTIATDIINNYFGTIDSNPDFGFDPLTALVKIRTVFTELLNTETGEFQNIVEQVLSDIDIELTTKLHEDFTLLEEMINSDFAYTDSGIFVSRDSIHGRGYRDQLADNIAFQFLDYYIYKFAETKSLTEGYYPSYEITEMANALKFSTFIQTELQHQSRNGKENINLIDVFLNALQETDNYIEFVQELEREGLDPHHIIYFSPIKVDGCELYFSSDQKDIQTKDATIEIKSEGLKHWLEFNHYKVDNEEKLSSIVTDWIKANPNLLQKLNIEDIAQITPYQTAVLAAKLVMDKMEYNRLDEYQKDKLSAEILLEDGEGVCRHYSKLTCAVFNTLKQLYPENLNNSYMQEIIMPYVNYGAYHAHVGLFTVVDENTLIVSQFDPTWAESSRLNNRLDYTEERILDLLYTLPKKYFPKEEIYTPIDNHPHAVSSPIPPDGSYELDAEEEDYTIIAPEHITQLIKEYREKYPFEERGLIDDIIISSSIMSTPQYIEYITPLLTDESIPFAAKEITIEVCKAAMRHYILYDDEGAFGYDFEDLAKQQERLSKIENLLSVIPDSISCIFSPILRETEGEIAEFFEETFDDLFENYEHGYSLFDHWYPTDRTIEGIADSYGLDNRKLFKYFTKRTVEYLIGGHSGKILESFRDQEVNFILNSLEEYRDEGKEINIETFWLFAARYIIQYRNN